MATDEQRTGWYYRLHAWALARGSTRYEDAVAERKRKLFGDLHGTVLELGPGGGVNLSYYPKDIHWIGIEPNPYNHPNIRKAAQHTGLNNIEFRSLKGNRLEANDNSIDAVVSTLVLCTVPDQDATLLEILRVLKPGGRFAFIEHVAAPRGTFLRSVQSFVWPAWSFLLDGCRPNCQTAEAITRAGFSEVNIETFRAPLPLVSPHISGLAIN
jgi:ubiquinone/menaquinone biosynthesis C-methylase UbiE